MKKYVWLAVIFSAIFILVLAVIPAAFSSVITTVLLGGEEESGSSSSEGYYISLLLSDEVEQYRTQVLAQAKKEGMEEYLELFLAVMMQESGGQGGDVFQCSESKGFAPNTLSTGESIKQGVAYLSAMLKRAGCMSPSDMPGIRLALQGYNFGGGYIDYALKQDGKWTQENTFAYAKKQSGGKRNTGSRVQVLGPWKYGDQYYTQHVLRYYSPNESADGSSSEAPADIPLAKRMDWLFPAGIPKTEKEMSRYLTQIKVPVYLTKKESGTITLTVHKKLASEITAVFQEMQEAKFPVLAEVTAGYTWRTMASNSSRLSYHSYGCVVDLNWTHNGASYTSWPYKPGKDKYAVTDKIVQIWKKHGFYWGGDWSGNTFDPMHFTYVNH